MDNEALYRDILDSLCDGVYFVDAERRILFWNRAAEHITGYPYEEIVGKYCQSNLLQHIDPVGRPLCLMACPLYASLIDGKRREDEVFLRHKDGRRIAVNIRIVPIRKEDTIIGAVETFSPNSPTVYDDDLIERLSSLAMNDQLTGIANRRKITSYLEYRLMELRRSGARFGVVFLDLDDFSRINNRYGHELGDTVLLTISRSIVQHTRYPDLFGRWGGEEFVGVFSIRRSPEAVAAAETIRTQIETTRIAHGTGSVSVTASLGVTEARRDDTVNSLIERADSLMYRSKANKKNRVTSDIGG